MLKTRLKPLFFAAFASSIISVFFIILAHLQYPDAPIIKIVTHPSLLKGYLYGFFLFWGNELLAKKLGLRYPKASDLSKKFLYYFGLSTLYTILVIFVVGLLFEDIIQFSPLTFSFTKLTSYLLNTNLAYYFQMIIITLIIGSVYHGFYFFKKFKEHQLLESEQKKQLLSAQLEGLKNQLDPHFLFNSLNVLNGLIEENPSRASEFLNHLSLIYRYVLQQKDQDLVSLAEEIAFIKNYLNLLSVRFENGLTYELQDSLFETEEQIIPLSLQLLVENAIKHNIISAAKPLYISISKRNDYLILKNNLNKKKNVFSTGLGLQNIQNRYNMLTEKPVLIEQNADFFEVAIPIL